MLEWIKTIWDYNYWAHRKMFNCVMALSEADFQQPVGYSVGSVHGQVLHVIGAEAFWYARINSEPLQYNGDDYPTRESIRTKWDEVEAKWRAYLDVLTEDELARTFEFDIFDYAASNVVREALWHVVNHGTDHRAQIFQLLHGYGVPTFEQDMFFYFKAMREMKTME